MKRTSIHMRTAITLAFAFSVVSVMSGVAAAAAPTDFESFAFGSVNYQGPGSTTTYVGGGGTYTVPDPYGSLWTVADEWGHGHVPALDEAVVDDGTGNTVWRFSNAVTGSFSDQPNTPSSDEVAGESGAALWNDRGTNHTAPTGPAARASATTPYFHAGFSFKSATGAAQSGLTLNMSPVPRQSGGRNGYINITDTGTGFDIGFFDTGALPAVPFNGTTIATGLSYADWHDVDIYVEFVDGLNGDGTGNDIVTVLVDGVVAHVGTTWETYYAAGGAPASPLAVDALAFRSSTGASANLGNGLFFDDVVVDNAELPTSDPTQVKQAVLDELTLLYATLTDKEDKSRLNDAINHLTKSLSPDKWLDASHPKPGKKGEGVFNEEKAAVVKLKELRNSNDSGLSAVQMQGYIDALVGDDRALATIAINEAVARVGNADKINKAQEALLKGDTEAGNDHPDKAIDQYKNAWKNAVAA